ncbi:hypothetical protein L1987_60125 [Smallanthus sonchifolius]|uniref:Uncharacterized protein n=1 Tax=Smallanthus sonchifolius TaxID=185202 RepID=A0ACB9D7T0_9ASTR|nr:hypothetical protein L1987_60125 [Smallanthus sonchifolius]
MDETVLRSAEITREIYQLLTLINLHLVITTYIGISKRLAKALLRGSSFGILAPSIMIQSSNSTPHGLMWTEEPLILLLKCSLQDPSKSSVSLFPSITYLRNNYLCIYRYMTKYNKVDIRAIKIWAHQIQLGLLYLHGHGPPVIHRDLKSVTTFLLMVIWDK